MISKVTRQIVDLHSAIAALTPGEAQAVVVELDQLRELVEEPGLRDGPLSELEEIAASEQLSLIDVTEAVRLAMLDGFDFFEGE